MSNTLIKEYSLEEIRQILVWGRFPVSGITPLGSAEFHFLEPAAYLGIALHSGSRIRPEISEALAVGQEDRKREEDPFTDQFVDSFPLQLIARDSRFEYDLNWEVEKSIYPAHEKKWGLQVWNRSLSKEETERTCRKHREFHELLDVVIDFILERNRIALLFDIHSFCYQRGSKIAWWKDDKPEINLGTRYINRDHFSSQLDLFLEGVSAQEIDDHKVRVAENEIFPGGYLTRKYAASHNQQVLVLAIEYKKIFMDELTGELFPHKLEMLKQNLLLTKERLIASEF